MKVFLDEFFPIWMKVYLTDTKTVFAGVIGTKNIQGFFFPTICGPD